MKHRDREKLKNIEWQKRILTLPFEDQVEHEVAELREGKDGE